LTEHADDETNRSLSYEDEAPQTVAVEAPAAPAPAPEPQPVREEVKHEYEQQDPSNMQSTDHYGHDDTQMNESNNNWQGNNNGDMNGYGHDEHNDMNGGDDDSYSGIGMKEDG
jgi:hypothetical protein